jgi:uncharacterized membrane protein YhhN
VGMLGETMSVFLSVVLAASVALALLHFRWLNKAASHSRALLKTLPVLLLSVYALIINAPLVLVAALALAALGDLCLAYDGEAPFMSGLAAFLLAHLAYVALFWPLADTGLIVESPWRYAFAWLFVMMAVAVLFLLWRPAGRLAGALGVYAAAIVAMALSALSVRSILPGAAAGLFVLSDAALGVQRFLVRPADPILAVLKPFVWGTYYAAQLIFTLAMAGLPGF